MDRKFILCAKMFLLMLGRDPIEGLFFTKDLKIQFGPPADLAAAHKWWCLSERHHSEIRKCGMVEGRPIVSLRTRDYQWHAFSSSTTQLIMPPRRSTRSVT